MSDQNDSARSNNVRPIRETADKVKEAVSDRYGAVRERVQDVAADVGERFRDLSADAGDTFRERTEYARGAARERLDGTADRMRDGYGQVRKSTDEFYEDASDFVRDNPGKAVLMAAGAGFVLGLLFRRRSEI